MRKFLGALFAGSCYLCRGSATSLLCAACDGDLPRLAPPRCPRCALDSPRGEVCGRCLRDSPHYDATFAALAYDFPADALVQALKFRGELALAGLLGEVLLKSIPENPIDCIIPVPLSAARLRERGYNPAAEIAKRLGRGRVDLTACVRSRDTPAQMDLPFAERRRNVRGAFACTRPLDGASVAVVDDVMTTGATLDEIAGALKKAGAGRVENWVVARTFAPD